MDEPQKRLMVAPRDGHRQVRDLPDQARHVQALLALREGAAEDQVLDVRGIDPGPLDQSEHDGGREVVRADPGEFALVREVEG